MRAFIAHGHVTLYADNVYVHYVDRLVRFVPSSRPQYRRESQQRSNVGHAKVYSVCTFNLTSHRVIVCAERKRIFYTLAIIVIGIIVIFTIYYVNGFKRVAARTLF